MELIDFIKKNNFIVMAKVITRSSRNELFIENNMLKIKINEIPENGKANEAIINLIHKIINIPKNNISILSGERKSIKKILIQL